ncbi:MAG: ABC transporter permease [Peptostreptococcaceae bacterium]|nr:ABC transporter permease [Peptostreptococcaceae bacterium]
METSKTTDFETLLGVEIQSKLMELERKANSPLKKLLRNKTAVIGLGIVAFMLFIAIFAPLLATANPNEIHPLNAYIKPFSPGHILGTDSFGRDLYSRILYGARISLLVAISSTAIGGIVGILLGLISGYVGGFVDSIIMRIMDGFLSFPFILLSIILMTVMGTGVFNVIIAIGIGNMPNFARVVRGEVIVVKNEEYCNVERVIGSSNIRLLFSHILPNVISPIIVYATLTIAGAIISEAALSFLGVGIAAPTASWGSILRDGRDCLYTASFIASISGFFILLTVLGFNLFGDGLRDVLDPKLKK